MSDDNFVMAMRYLGFCVRSGAVTYGVDNIAKSRKRAFLIIMDYTLGESSAKELRKIADSKKCRLVCARSLDVLINRSGVKAVALTNQSLSVQIAKHLDFINN